MLNNFWSISHEILFTQLSATSIFAIHSLKTFTSIRPLSFVASSSKLYYALNHFHVRLFWSSFCLVLVVLHTIVYSVHTAPDKILPIEEYSFVSPPPFLFLLHLLCRLFFSIVFIAESIILFYPFSFYMEISVDGNHKIYMLFLRQTVILKHPIHF